MKKLLFIIFIISGISAKAQDTLPNFNASSNGKDIIISWKNAYLKPVATINIQRSYDSLKNFTTIGSILNPQNFENGFADFNPPYNKMFYRIFIAFEDGTYKISQSAKPVRLPEPEKKPVPEPETEYIIDSVSKELVKRQVWQAEPVTEPVTKIPTLPSIKLPVEKEITYPSKRVYSTKDQNVIIHLPDAIIKNYSIKFFNDRGTEILILKRLKEDYLILEKVYFMKSGWFNFEIYESNKLIEKNKLFIPKDIKINK